MFICFACSVARRAAHEAGASTAIINIGPTRADDIVSLKIKARCGEVGFLSFFFLKEEN